MLLLQSKSFITCPSFHYLFPLYPVWEKHPLCSEEEHRLHIAQETTEPVAPGCKTVIQQTTKKPQTKTHKTHDKIENNKEEKSQATRNHRRDER